MYIFFICIRDGMSDKLLMIERKFYFYEIVNVFYLMNYLFMKIFYIWLVFMLLVVGDIFRMFLNVFF